jgi:hypothetical protein
VLAICARETQPTWPRAVRTLNQSVWRNSITTHSLRSATCTMG